VRDRHGECLGALSVTLPVDSTSVEAMQAKVLPLLREAEAGLRGLL
jgi:DNA-binding IclR family transcriptional regulator